MGGSAIPATCLPAILTCHRSIDSGYCHLLPVLCLPACSGVLGTGSAWVCVSTCYTCQVGLRFPATCLPATCRLPAVFLPACFCLPVAPAFWSFVSGTDSGVISAVLPADFTWVWVGLLYRFPFCLPGGLGLPFWACRPLPSLPAWVRFLHACLTVSPFLPPADCRFLDTACTIPFLWVWVECSFGSLRRFSAACLPAYRAVWISTCLPACHSFCLTLG